MQDNFQRTIVYTFCQSFPWLQSSNVYLFTYWGIILFNWFLVQFSQQEYDEFQCTVSQKSGFQQIVKFFLKFKKTEL